MTFFRIRVFGIFMWDCQDGTLVKNGEEKGVNENHFYRLFFFGSYVTSDGARLNKTMAVEGQTHPKSSSTTK